MLLNRGCPGNRGFCFCGRLIGLRNAGKCRLHVAKGALLYQMRQNSSLFCLNISKCG